MKRAFIIIVICTLAIISCEKKSTSTMTVIKDCTGTYLRLDGKDFPVCNYKILSSFEDGTQVTATYKNIGDGVCEGKGVPNCMIAIKHNLGEWIEITKVK